MRRFRVRLNCIDHYQSLPTKFDPQLRNDVAAADIHRGPKVPVVRVFGSTETGQKVCAHIHGAFPYLFIEYDGDLDPEKGEKPYRAGLGKFALTFRTVRCSWRLHVPPASLDRSCARRYLSP